MKYTMTTPCDACPFLTKHAHAYQLKRLKQFASGPVVCHKTGQIPDDYDGHGDNDDAGYQEKPDGSSQMMRIAERLRLYDRTTLNMGADVR